MDKYITATYLARELSVTPAAVSNWLARGVLPSYCKPVTEAWSAKNKCTYLWRASQLFALREWHMSKPEVKDRKRRGTDKN